MANPGGQRALTRVEYDRLSPKDKGYVSYYQGAWNPDVPEWSPYAMGSPEQAQWEAGQRLAVVHVTDAEE